MPLCLRLQLFSMYTFFLPVVLCLIKGGFVPPVSQELIAAWAAALVAVLLVPPVRNKGWVAWPDGGIRGLPHGKSVHSLHGGKSTPPAN